MADSASLIGQTIAVTIKSLRKETQQRRNFPPMEIPSIS